MEKQMIAKAINKMTRFQLSTFLMLCCISSQVFALNLSVGPEKPRDFALAERADPFGRTVSSYIIPEKWTNIVSALLCLMAMLISAIVLATKKHSSLLMGFVVTALCALATAVFATWTASWFIGA